MTWPPGLERRPPADVSPLFALARERGIDLPADYVAFMRESDGAGGRVGEAWLELWPVERIVESAEPPIRYEDVLLFAGDGANTIYGFDERAGGEIVEGDWIGLDRHELIRHGHTFAGFLRSVRGPSDA